MQNMAFWKLFTCSCERRLVFGSDLVQDFTGMAVIQILLGAVYSSTATVFWPAFLAGAFVFSVVWLAKRLPPDGCPPLIGPKSFPELSGFPEAEQKGLLHEASREAFRGWRAFVPIILFAAIFATGVALGYALPLLTTFPNSLWLWVLIGALFAVLAGWFVARLERRWIKPVLRKMSSMRSQ